MRKRRGKTQKRKPWQPLVGGPPARAYLERLTGQLRELGMSDETIAEQLPDRVWLNDRYQVLERRANEAGLLHLSIHRHDRRAVRDWRELQQIKNEVAGRERCAIEVFPPESQLVDTSNEYHLWVLPEGDELDLLKTDRLVLDAGSATAGRVAGENKARQRPWTPGLTTGKEE
jgi:hypothetical protein